MSPPVEPTVHVRALAKSFDGEPAVRGLDLTATNQEITAVLGPNGAGKTTTLEIIAGLQKADAGSVQVLGRDPWDANADHRASVGVMLQQGGVWSTATAKQAVSHVSRFYRDPIPTEELLERLRLGPKQRRTAFRRLSGGEQQRVKLACAVVGRPQLVILDEPSSGLDPATRIELWDLIKDLQGSGATILLSTHSMAEAEALAEHVVIISQGRAVAAGSTAALTQDSDRQSLWFRARSRLDPTALLAALPTGHRLTEQSPGRYKLHGAAVTPAVIAAVTSWCADQGALATDIQLEQRSLEDVFLEVTAP